MGRKVFKTGNSVVVSLPKDTLDALGLAEGSEVDVELDRQGGRIIIRPTMEPPLPGVDQEFARQVTDFIERYRPALEALAR